MPKPPLVVCAAPRTFFNRLVATLNFTYALGSHVVSPYVRGQGRTLLTQRFGPICIAHLGDLANNIRRFVDNFCG